MVIFSKAQGQLTQQPVVGSGQNSDSSELSCMSSLPASMKKLWGEKQHRKSGNIDFLDTQGQVTLWSDLAESQIHPSSNVCYRYLEVRNGSDQKWQHGFLHYKSMGIFSDTKDG